MRLAVLFALAAGVGCTEVHGRFVAQGPPLGDWELLPDDCASGQPHEFFGVDLWRSDHEDRSVRLVEDAVRGRFVIVKLPALPDPGLQLSPANCSRLDAHLEFDGWVHNHVNDLDGWLDLLCATPDQGSFRGSVSFQHCH